MCLALTDPLESSVTDAIMAYSGSMSLILMWKNKCWCQVLLLLLQSII